MQCQGTYKPDKSEIAINESERIRIIGEKPVRQVEQLHQFLLSHIRLLTYIIYLTVNPFSIIRRNLQHGNRFVARQVTIHYLRGKRDLPFIYPELFIHPPGNYELRKNVFVMMPSVIFPAVKPDKLFLSLLLAVIEKIVWTDYLDSPYYAQIT